MGKSTYLNQGKAVASWLQEVSSPMFLEVLDVLEFASWPLWDVTASDDYTRSAKPWNSKPLAQKQLCLEMFAHDLFCYHTLGLLGGAKS